MSYIVKIHGEQITESPINVAELIRLIGNMTSGEQLCEAIELLQTEASVSNPMGIEIFRVDPTSMGFEMGMEAHRATIIESGYAKAVVASPLPRDRLTLSDMTAITIGIVLSFGFAYLLTI